MNPDHLVELAGHMVQIGAGVPRQATLNRAVSTACYALFHAVANLFADGTVGPPTSPRHWEVVAAVHRAVDHAAARKVFDRIAGESASSASLKQVSRAFVELQKARIAADYDPDPDARCSRRQALDFIDQARSAIDVLRALPKDDRLVVVARLIAKQR